MMQTRLKVHNQTLNAEVMNSLFIELQLRRFKELKRRTLTFVIIVHFLW